MPTRLKRKQFSCLHRLRPEISVILNDVTQPPEVLDSFHKVLGRRECVLWTTGIEMVIAAVSFVGFDIRRSPLVLIVSSVLLLLAAIGFHGALVVSQLHIFMHMLLATSIPAAVCINFAVEDFAGVFDGKSQTPSWLLLLLLTLPYVVFLCLALVSFMLGIAVAELKQKIAEATRVASFNRGYQAGSFVPAKNIVAARINFGLLEKMDKSGRLKWVPSTEARRTHLSGGSDKMDSEYGFGFILASTMQRRVGRGSPPQPSTR